MSANHLYWWWKKSLDVKTIKEINKFIIKNYGEIETDQLKAKDNDGNLKKNTKTFLIQYKKIKKYFAPLIEDCMIQNKVNFGYDLHPVFDSILCNYNIYDSTEGANYDWHVDISPNPYEDVKLTVIINLSEKICEGGKLYLQSTNEMEIPELNEIGSMVMFQSGVRHRVSSITKGLRKNITFFLTGPNFK